VSSSLIRHLYVVWYYQLGNLYCSCPWHYTKLSAMFEEIHMYIVYRWHCFDIFLARCYIWCMRRITDPWFQTDTLCMILPDPDVNQLYFTFCQWHFWSCWLLRKVGVFCAEELALVSWPLFTDDFIDGDCLFIYCMFHVFCRQSKRCSWHTRSWHGETLINTRAIKMSYVSYLTLTCTAQ